MDLTLVLLAAGKGSRFGGLKQLHTFLPQQATLAEYAIYDAQKAGFNHFVAIVSEETKVDFEHIFKKLNLEHCSQCVLQPQSNFENRKKPWGTGHALLSVKDVVKTPFVIVNGDDFYGDNAYALAAHFLKNNHQDFAMVGYRLSETLSENGYVSRALCALDNNRVTALTEYTHIEKSGNETVDKTDNNTVLLDKNAFVSMNFWVLHPRVFDYLQEEWEGFFNHIKCFEKEEFYLPVAIQNIAKKCNLSIHLLPNYESHWLGITYANDVKIAQEKLLQLTHQGKYPKKF